MCKMLHAVEDMCTTRGLHYNSILGTAYVDVKTNARILATTERRQNADMLARTLKHIF